MELSVANGCGTWLTPENRSCAEGMTCTEEAAPFPRLESDAWEGDLESKEISSLFGLLEDRLDLVRDDFLEDEAVSFPFNNDSSN